MVIKKLGLSENYDIGATNSPQGFTNEVGVPEGFSKEVTYEDKLQGIDEIIKPR
ncbi:hypothetical protein ACMYUM_27455 (plasmid) [Priestia megaterium]|uniref:hypothetical protein n=1 Tax=Priestia TaxID=2800373 RepID=UPI00196B1844|nr:MULTISPECIES: hypothetical protein [Priestia]MCW1048953.1 hypothetical protein [Priestia sp. JV24]QSF42174.1 hypothetical protein ICR96_29250 [Priestia megaterium]